MATKLIELQDGMFVEVEVPEAQAQQISGGFAEKVGATFEERVKPMLLKACKPIMEVWQELNREMHVEEAEVELGLSFEGEGNLYLAKSKAGAHVTVKLKLKPKKQEDSDIPF